MEGVLNTQIYHLHAHDFFVETKRMIEDTSE